MLRATSFAHAVSLERLDQHYQAMAYRKVNSFWAKQWFIQQIVLYALICKEH